MAKGAKQHHKRMLGEVLGKGHGSKKRMGKKRR